MSLSIVPVPQISISLASPEEPAAEPFSPFASETPAIVEEDMYRPSLLSPPPTVSPKPVRQLSPLRPADAPNTGKGLERERFDALLKASRERNASIGTKRSLDLRKEIALKAHKTKQMERRALFLSKVQAPPSPSAAVTPKTPPESPAIFHYKLPSPGLESPLEVFESLGLDKSSVSMCQPWVEQVDFRLPSQRRVRATSKPGPVTCTRNALPSLDQITARMSSHGVVAPTQETAPQGRIAARLPAFLQLGKRPPPKETVRVFTGDTLQDAMDTTPITHLKPLPPFYPPPVTPTSPDLRITTTVVPHSSSPSPVKLTVANVDAFNRNARQDTARNMLMRLRRRTLPPMTAGCYARSHSVGGEDEKERKFRRRSAPPELPERERYGFTHPVLQLPGAF